MSKNNFSVQAKNIKKSYKLYKKNTDRLKEALLGSELHQTFHALNGVDFEVGKNEVVGIIGQNGAGKSTLLKILTGVMSPTEGELVVNGRVAAILELGAGFNPESSGIENVKFNCMLMGLDKHEIEARLTEIMDFADIGEHIYQPVKTYSSGMVARLAFATAINVDPDILIIDEALSVGDMYFQAKSISKLKEIMKNKTVFFVSHNMEVLRSLCNRAIYLKDGKVFMDGDVKKVTQVYETDNNKRIAALNKDKSLSNLLKTKSNKDATSTIGDNGIDLEFADRVQEFRSGTGDMRFVRADLYVNGKKSNEVPFGANCKLKLVIQCNEDVKKGATIGYTVRNKNGLDIFGLNIYNQSKLLPQMSSGDLLEVDIEFQNKLAPNQGYSIGLGLKPRLHDASFYDAIYSALIFDVPTLENKNWVPGIMYLEQEMKYKVHSNR